MLNPVIKNATRVENCSSRPGTVGAAVPMEVIAAPLFGWVNHAGPSWADQTTSLTKVAPMPKTQSRGIGLSNASAKTCAKTIGVQQPVAIRLARGSKPKIATAGKPDCDRTLSAIKPSTATDG